MQDRSRQAALLMHITSMSGKYPIGTIKDAYDFLPKIQEAGFKLLQVLPIGPTGYGNSPYAPRSSFAGSEALISLDWLVEDSLLDAKDIRIPSFNPSRVDYHQSQLFSEPLLAKAARRLLKSPSKAYEDFCLENKAWLDDYALFMVISRQCNDQRWFSVWDKALGLREEAALSSFRARWHEDIELWKVFQYFFQVQWKRLLSRSHELGLELIGDMPIYAAPDSSDTWADPALFSIQEGGALTEVSGVPPDSFSVTGQLWGNPVYDWKLMAKDGYDWWMRRISRSAELFDIIRIDHFRGFESYWAVPYGSATAENGQWRKGPGKAFFKALKSRFPALRIIAEDLGFITPPVRELLDYAGYPGMRIASECLADGRIDPEALFMPHNYPSNCVAYTGTHDNHPYMGFLKSQGQRTIASMARYLGCSEDLDDIRRSLIRALCFSKAGIVAFPMQDLLGLGDEARMNLPSTCNQDNWSWRMKPGQFDEATSAWIKDLLEIYGR